MGGVVRKVGRALKRAGKEAGKAAGLTPTNKEKAAAEVAAKEAQERAAAEAAARNKAAAEAEAKRKAEEATKAQQAVDVVDANNPDDVMYSGDQAAGKPKKKRKKGRTIMTGSQGVIGDAPTEKSTLLGG